MRPITHHLRDTGNGAVLYSERERRKADHRAPTIAAHAANRERRRERAERRALAAQENGAALRAVSPTYRVDMRRETSRTRVSAPPRHVEPERVAA